jgi:uncharacterized protein DUF2703
MRSLDIVWQRLVKDGQTCNRCGSTQQSVQAAVSTLRAVLRPLDIEPVLESVAIDEAAFKENTLESNRITIAGKPLEYWIGGKTGSSECWSVCGTSQCRTVEVDGSAYEAIPEELIVKAGLRAAAELTGTPRQKTCDDQCGCASAGEFVPAGEPEAAR